MYAVKASWVGQTFALATTNDSGGRKSRIWRSKEERKAMAESFIKRYQILNDGNFPSLNLTHKEVGGSFYTVREIVREIIQENKVLGPARFSGEAHKDHIVADSYSSGSSSSQAQFFLSVNELDGVSKYQENDSVGLKLDVNGHYTNHQDLDSPKCSTEQQADEMGEDSDELAENSLNEKDRKNESLEPSLNSIAQHVNENQIDDAQLANVTQSDGVSKGSDEMLREGSLVSKTSQGDREKEFVGACNAELTLPTKELELETFPLRPATKEIYGMSGTSTGSVNIYGTLKHLVTKHNGHLDSPKCSAEQQADEMGEDSDELAEKSLNEKDRQYESLEPSLNNTAQHVNENQIDDAQFANGAQSDGVSKESDEMLREVSLVNKTSQGDREKELVGACNAEQTLPTKKLEVETFPLRPATKEIDGMSGTSTVSVNVNGTLNHLVTKHNEISNGVPQFDKFGSPDSLSDLVSAKGADGSEHSTTVPGIVKQQAEINDKVIQGEEANHPHKTLEMLASSAIRDKSLALDQGCVDKVASHSGSTSTTIELSEEVDGLQSKKAPTGITGLEESSTGTSNKITSKAPFSGVANGSYIQKGNRAMSGASPTLDRIDLESWESKETSNQETNPLLAFFKAFVDAFVKFWSE